MRESLWIDVLQEFQATEVDEPIIFVIEDGWLRRTLAAWSVLPGIHRPADHARTAIAWEALWQGVEFDLHLLAEHLDTWEGHAKQLFERARALKLIYPDGSIHAKAKRILLDRVADAVKEEEDEDDR